MHKCKCSFINLLFGFEAVRWARLFDHLIFDAHSTGLALLLHLRLLIYLFYLLFNFFLWLVKLTPFVKPLKQ